ncbi:MAG: aspartate-semialdehyde dehydrogenase [Candidatus Marinimicrobia bacterium]|nr:aspartate-semialdehyde dehydrogenase [Candidatus Neomarinimicrobiota bacterium]
MAKKLKVGILGATGAVGQRFVELLEGHPWFEIGALYASGRSAGKTYKEAVDWKVPVTRPTYLDGEVVRDMQPDEPLDLVFSALPRETAKTVEVDFARAGVPVISNASAYRMGQDIPLLIPEVNPEHTGLIDYQRQQRGWDGYIVTNPNCSVIGLVLALKPLDDAFSISQVNVVTMQAKSGAGYPGPPPEVIDDNVLPFIGGEEDKLEEEPAKLLGTLGPRGIKAADLVVSAQCNRVNVLDGHLEAVNLKFRQPASVEEVTEALNSFRSVPQEAGLPFAPDQPVTVREEDDRPQPKLDRDTGKGMTATVGRIRPDSLFDIKFMVLSHNTIRGAAGAAILNAELLKHQGYL